MSELAGEGMCKERFVRREGLRKSCIEVEGGLLSGESDWGVVLAILNWAARVGKGTGSGNPEMRKSIK